MKSVIPKLMPTFLCSLVAFTHSAIAQGTFQNLDFEQADPAGVSQPMNLPYYTAASCVPGWTCYLGQHSWPYLLYNEQTLGDASIDILDVNDQSGPKPIEGQFDIFLRGGAYPPDAPLDAVSASISQTAFLPANAESLEFKAVADDFTVSLGGDNLTLFPLQTGANYTLYGANVAQFAGKEETLTITEMAYGAFDSFQFSPSPVPEPNSAILILVGAGIFGIQAPLRFIAKRKT